MKKHFLLIPLCLTLLEAAAQIQPGPKKQPGTQPVYKFKPDEVRKIVNLQFTYDYQIPAGDMAKRFGNSSCIGTGVMYKDKKNFMWGLEGGFIFGSNVRENTILDSLYTSNNYIIGLRGGIGTYSPVTLSERGYSFTGKVGKVFPLFKNNRNSGVFISAGVGFLQHKIRIAVPDNNIPLLTKDYRKGYDRLSNGLVLTQFVGYYYVDRKRFINFYAGFNLSEGFTQSRRDWNYDTRTKDTEKRTDILQGFRFGWIIPIYPSSRDDEYFFY